MNDYENDYRVRFLASGSVLDRGRRTDVGRRRDPSAVRGLRFGTMPRVLHRWRFAIDLAVAAVVGCVVVALISKSASWTLSSITAFVAVFVGGVSAQSFRRAFVRALLAAAAALFALLGYLDLTYGFEELIPSFHENETGAPGLAAYWPLFAVGALIPAVMTALVAHALAVGWGTRGLPLDSADK